jgi:membrane protease YdiL (CAAX protease family)
MQASPPASQIAETRPHVAPTVPWHPLLGLVYTLLVFFCSQVAAALILLVGSQLYLGATGRPDAKATELFDMSVSGQFAYILLAEALAVGATLGFVRAYRTKLSAIGLRRPRWSDLGYGLLCAPAYFLVYLVVAAALSQLIPGLDLNQEQEIGFDNISGKLQLAMAFVSLVILPPIAEEIMMRGFLYSSLKKGLKLFWAVILTSIIFAIAHLPTGGAGGPLYIAAVDTFILSLFLIYLREKTGGLWSSMVLHGLKNAVAFTALFVLKVG